MVAVAPVNVTVPKFAKGTRAPPDSKSSTIHSALSSWRALLCEVKVWVTDFPFIINSQSKAHQESIKWREAGITVETLSTTAVPDVVEVAVTVTGVKC